MPLRADNVFGVDADDEPHEPFARDVFGQLGDLTPVPQDDAVSQLGDMGRM
jgi:hypothetical protein